MLIKALCDYYDILSANNLVLPDGYSNVDISYLVCLTPEGRIDEIIDWRRKYEIADKKGQPKFKFSPKTEIMPKRTEKSAIDGNIIEHRPLYIFGLGFFRDQLLDMKRAAALYDADHEDYSAAIKAAEKAEKSHKAFADTNLMFIEGLDSPVVNAYREFIRNWKPEDECENASLLGLGKAYPSVGYAFCLTGHPEMMLHCDPGLKAKWETFHSDTSADKTNAQYAQCSISGEYLPIARIHGKIKGVSGGLSTGTVLVGFNNPSENSYCNDQSYNSNISESVAKKYVEALNYLLKGNENGRTHKAVLDDMTVVYWAMSDDSKYEDLLGQLLFDQNGGASAEETEDMLRSLMTDAREGNIAAERICSLEAVDPGVEFYILGIKPNSSRISVKFLYRRKFGEILQNIAQHQLDMQISEEMQPIPLWRIKSEMVSPKSSNDNVDPSLMSKIMQSVIYGTKYPVSLLAKMVRRVQIDADTKDNYFIKVNAVRAGVIKACIMRSSREREVLKVALDKDNTNQAYVCGRLFAVLEKLQQDASGNSLNRTIKDAYFASASSKPAVIFPKLLQLAQYHLNKVKSGAFYNILIAEIMDKLSGEFPNILSLEDQGRFIIGYYQQRQTFFYRKDNNTKEE